jgi:hypothetical protein
LLIAETRDRNQQSDGIPTFLIIVLGRGYDDGYWPYAYDDFVDV